MIPKLIHYIWIGEKPMPNDVLKNRDLQKVQSGLHHKDMG